MADCKTVAVVIPWRAYGQSILLGISKFVYEHPEWVLHLIQAESPVLNEDLMRCEADGVISCLLNTSKETADSLCRCPAVSVLVQPDQLNIPFVIVDEDAVGRMAAEYYLDRKFRNFAFIGNSEHKFSVQRANAFESAVNKQGFGCSKMLYSTRIRDVDEEELLRAEQKKVQWLNQLPKPVAVFACSDGEAFRLIQLCRQEGCQVPEDVAVLGVGNEALFCNVANPPLSSIRIPYERIGYDAAVLLDAVLNGKRIAQEKNLLPPSGLVSRQSTDVMRVKDPVVSDALQFIQEHISQPINVKDIVKRSGISRTLLERKFRLELGYTPLVEIRRQRIQRVKQLLADTDLSIAEIADSCGFGSDTRLSMVFKELTGRTPTGFRKEVKAPSSVHEM